MTAAEQPPIRGNEKANRRCQLQLVFLVDVEVAFF